jgi:hypothetical protein
MNIRMLALSALSAAALGTGCTTTAKVMSLPGIGVNANALQREEYVVLGDAEGKACVEETCFFGIFCSTKSDTGSTERQEGRLFTDDVQTAAPTAAIPFLQGAAGTEGNRSAAEDAALFKAIQSVPDADALLVPRKSMELTTSNNFISTSQKACVRVFGKGIRLKTDAEVAGGAAPAPAPAPEAAPAPAPAG